MKKMIYTEKSIERKRLELVKTQTKHNSFTHPDVIRLSEELDDMIVAFHKKNQRSEWNNGKKKTC